MGGKKGDGPTKTTMCRSHIRLNTTLLRSEFSQVQFPVFMFYIVFDVTVNIFLWSVTEVLSHHEIDIGTFLISSDKAERGCGHFGQRLVAT